MSTLTSSAFHLLLQRLDADSATAAGKYEDLRMKIVHLLRWRGCAESHSDELADVVLDRIAVKITDGEDIENLNAFAAGVARFVWLEHSRKYKLDAVGDDLPETPVQPDIDSHDGDEPRTRCLRRCVSTSLGDEDRRLVIGYYDTDAGEKAKQARKRLADSLGMTMNALKVRACRLRLKLEACITGCVAGVTKRSSADTSIQEVA
jgi:DNA-directed RNA polymerase specialized sigma24 family protein